MTYFLLALIAAIFVLLPVWRFRRDEQGGDSDALRTEHNRRVHADQLADLRADLEEGKITLEHFNDLEQELLAGYASTRQEVVQSSPMARGTRLTLFVASAGLILASFFAYTKLGYRNDVLANEALQRFLAAETKDESSRRADLLELLPIIEERGNAAGSHLGWRFMLAQLQSQLQRYAEAADSYRTILKADESNADVWAEYAQAVYLSNARQLTEPVNTALEKALSINPHQRTALSLQGMHAFENKDFQAAEQSWGQLLAGLQPGTEYYQLISKARERASQSIESSAEAGSVSVEPKDTLLSGATSAADAADATSSISVDVELAEHIKLANSTTVFVYARAANGPKMPLAIQRLTVADLPRRIELNDSMAMMPAMRLSMFDDIEVLARVSTSGSPSPESGDWQASSGSLQRQQITAPLSLRIAQQLP